MADPTFQQKLNSFLECEETRASDYVTYITMLSRLAKLLENENNFNVYVAVIKNWISEFQTIFSEKRTQKDAKTFWNTYMSKFCAKITEIFFALLQCFRQFDPNYTQELYIHWKTMVSRLNKPKRAEAYRDNVDMFKIVIQHLRTAASRTEQFAVLAVLRLYIECVPLMEIGHLLEHDNTEVVTKVAEFMKKPTILNEHALLHDINALGHCIESLKPKKIVCKKWKIDMNDTDFAMWLDFNKTEKSITFSTVSLADRANHTFATARRVKLSQSMYDDHLLEINGIWNVISVDNEQRIGQKVKVKVYFLDETERLISKKVKSVFPFSKDGSPLHGFVSDDNEPELAPNVPECEVPQESLLSVVPPKLIQLDDGLEFLEATPPKPSNIVPPPRLSKSLPIFPRTEHDNETDAEMPVKSNMTYVIRGSVKLMGTPRSDDDPDAKYVLRKSVNPIAADQLENDHESQNYYDEDGMDIESPPIQLASDNESVASNRTYIIGDGALSDISNEAGQDNAEVNPKLCPDDFVIEYDEYDDMENEDPKSRYGNKKIEILENITIVPPTSQPELRPMRYFLSDLEDNARLVRYTQVDEQISINRKEAHNQYSQPITSQERFYVKGSSFQPRNIGTIQSNEPVQRLSQRPSQVSPTKIHFVNRNESMRSNPNVFLVPLVPNAVQSPYNHDDHQQNVSTGLKQQSQAALPLPVEITCGSQFESFIPLAASTQQAPVVLRKESHPQQTSQLSQEAIDPPSRSFGESMTQTGSSQDKAGLNVNKSLSRTAEVLQNVRETASGTLQTSDKENERNAGIVLSSSQASKKISSLIASQPTPEATPKRAKCIAIADLPKAQDSQLQVGSTNQRGQKSSQKDSKTTESFTEKQLSSSLQQHIEVPVFDPQVDLSKTNLSLNSSRKRTKSQIQSMSAPQREQTPKKPNATPKEPPSKNSSQQMAASSPRQQSASSPQQQLIESVPIIDPHVAMESSQKSKRAKLSESQIQSDSESPITQIPKAASLAQKQPLSSDTQRFDDGGFVDIPDVMDNFESTPKRIQMSESLANSTATKISQREKNLSQNPTASMTKRKALAQKIVKNSPKNESANASKPFLKRDTIKKLITAVMSPLSPKRESKRAPRYLSLKDTKSNSRNLPTSQFDNVETHNECNKPEAEENVQTDGIRVDDRGTVYDGEGSVFNDNDELQRAAKFYIANNGLDFLKKESVASMSAKKRAKYERKLKTIRRMIDRGFEGKSQTKEAKNVKLFDPYELTVAEMTLQGEKPKRKIKKVTMSKKTIVKNGKGITFARRTSKLYYIFDESAPTNAKSKVYERKSMSKEKQLFNKPKTGQTVKTPRSSSVNLSAEKNTNRKSEGTPIIRPNQPDTEPSLNFLEMDLQPIDDNVAEAISTTPTVEAKQPKSHNEKSPTSLPTLSLPTYAPAKVIHANESKMTNKTNVDPSVQRQCDKSLSTNVDCIVRASTNGFTLTDDCEMDPELCSTTTCSCNMKDLLAYLKGTEMESDHSCQGACEQNRHILNTFIDCLQRKQFHHDVTGSDWVQLFNCLLESVESMCDTASDQLQRCA